MLSLQRFTALIAIAALCQLVPWNTHAATEQQAVAKFGQIQSELTENDAFFGNANGARAEADLKGLVANFMFLGYTGPFPGLVTIRLGEGSMRFSAGEANMYDAAASEGWHSVAGVAAMDYLNEGRNQAAMGDNDGAAQSFDLSITASQAAIDHLNAAQASFTTAKNNFDSATFWYQAAIDYMNANP